jgi:type IV secretion system protein VirB6
MALGPVFIILSLFSGTRGLFEGWLKAAVMLAITPMLAVLLGGGTLVLIAPMISGLARAGRTVSLELATSIFLAACVYAALMALAMRAAAAITGGWRLGHAPADPAPPAQPSTPVHAPSTPLPLANGLAVSTATGDRLRGVPSAGHRASMHVVAGDSDRSSPADRRTQIVPAAPELTGASTDQATRDPRIRPLGQGFRAPKWGAA